MLKIISFTKGPKDTEVGWIQNDTEYKSFVLPKDDKIKYKTTFLISKYRDYLHFIGVQSKFNPYTSFLIKPISIKKLTYNTSKAARKEFENEHRRSTS